MHSPQALAALIPLLIFIFGNCWNVIHFLSFRYISFPLRSFHSLPEMKQKGVNDNKTINEWNVLRHNDSYNPLQTNWLKYISFISNHFISLLNHSISFNSILIEVEVIECMKQSYYNSNYSENIFSIQYSKVSINMLL